jgi:hypothetical protein
MDKAFDAIYGDILRKGSVNWMLFAESVNDFLASNPSPEKMDQFFEAAEPISFYIAECSKIEEACNYWLKVLSVVTNNESQLGRQYHKGSGYFFWACSWFARGDVDAGMLIMNKALLEDKRKQSCSNGIWPVSAATMVITLDNDPALNHPACWWVNEQVQAIDEALAEANQNLTK